MVIVLGDSLKLTSPDRRDAAAASFPVQAEIAEDSRGAGYVVIRSSTASATVVEGIPDGQSGKTVVIGDSLGVGDHGSARFAPDVTGVLQIPNVTRR